MNDFGGDDEDARRRELLKLVGRTIGDRYHLIALAGSGGMGAVYEAEHVGLARKVAVKIVDASHAADRVVAARFAREARAASSIESEHIVSVFDTGTDDGRPYLVMELLRGEDLGARLYRLGRLSTAEALHIAAQVLRGLSRAHHAGIVHRDLKPDNVFLVHKDGDASFVKIVDFGISKIARARSGTAALSLTRDGTVVGTPLYMSPEQAQAAGDLDARTDLYSVGAILFECLTGRPPHPGTSYEQIILAICMQDAPDVRDVKPGIAAPVAAFVRRALARDRQARFQDATEMLVALHEIAPEERTRAPVDPSLAATVPGMPPTSLPPSGEAAGAGSGNRASGAAAPTGVTWAGTPRPDGADAIVRSSGAAAAPSLSSSPSARRGVGRRVAVPASAIVAALAGVGVAMWGLSLVRPAAAPAARDVPSARPGTEARAAEAPAGAASANGANGAANGANGDPRGANGAANGANGAANGPNGAANGPSGAAHGPNGTGDGAHDVANGVNDAARGANGDFGGIGGAANGANGAPIGPHGGPTGANGAPAASRGGSAGPTGAPSPAPSAPRPAHGAAPRPPSPSPSPSSGGLDLVRELP